MKRQKFLPACKAVSNRNSQLKLLLEEPLEVSGNTHPRYMTVHDRIRLIDAAKSGAKAPLFVLDVWENNPQGGILSMLYS